MVARASSQRSRRIERSLVKVRKRSKLGVVKFLNHNLIREERGAGIPHRIVELCYIILLSRQPVGKLPDLTSASSANSLLGLYSTNA